MYDSHIVWGDGSGYNKGAKITQYSKRSMETVPELFKKAENDLQKLKTEEIYFINDCIVFLMSTGEVFQKGAFDFQKQNKSTINNQDVTQIPLPENITKIRFGENHVIFLSKEGNVFTMGDNYYGQLGIDNNMVSRKNEPVQLYIPNTTKCFEIHAYKNTSFAINSENQLFIWGKSEFIPKHIGNLYAPTRYFPYLKVKSIRHDSNRIIIDSTVIEQAEIDEKRRKQQELLEEEEGLEMGEDEDEMLYEEEEMKEEENIDEENEWQNGSQNVSQSVSKVSKDQQSKLKPKESFKLSYNRRTSRKVSGLSKYSIQSKRMTEEEREIARYKQIKILLRNLKSFNEKFNQLFTSLSTNEDKQIELIEEIVSSQSKYLLKDKALSMTNRIDDIVIKLFTNWLNPQQKKIEDVLSSFFLLTMSQVYFNSKENKYETLIRQLNFQAEKFSKEYKIFLTKKDTEFFLQKTSVNREENYEKAILKEFNALMPYMLRYKKTEQLIYKLTMHQAILNTYEMNNVKNALEEDFKSNTHSIGKRKLIIEKFGLIKSLLNVFSSNFKEIDLLYISLPQRMNVQNKKNELPEQSEKYIYKTLIQSTIFITDLWKTTMEKFKVENERRERQKVIAKSIARFKDIYCTQIYLEKLDFPFPKKKGPMNPHMQKKIIESISQIDGCIFHIQKLIDEVVYYEKQEEIKDKKLFLMYASSVLDSGRLQRMIWYLLFEQLKIEVI